jgi:hypothetical protein
MYILKNRLMFHNGNLRKSPIISGVEYFSQFALSLDKYRDNNNQLEVHNIVASDNRYLGSENEFKTFTIKPYPPWTTGYYSTNPMISRDGGKSYSREEGN